MSVMSSVTILVTFCFVLYASAARHGNNGGRNGGFNRQRGGFGGYAACANVSDNAMQCSKLLNISGPPKFQRGTDIKTVFQEQCAKINSGASTQQLADACCSMKCACQEMQNNDQTVCGGKTQPARNNGAFGKHGNSTRGGFGKGGFGKNGNFTRNTFGKHGGNNTFNGTRFGFGAGRGQFGKFGNGTHNRNFTGFGGKRGGLGNNGTFGGHRGQRNGTRQEGGQFGGRRGFGGNGFGGRGFGQNGTRGNNTARGGRQNGPGATYTLCENANQFTCMQKLGNITRLSGKPKDMKTAFTEKCPEIQAAIQSQGLAEECCNLNCACLAAAQPNDEQVCGGIKQRQTRRG